MYAFLLNIIVITLLLNTMTNPIPSNTELDAFMNDFMSRQPKLVVGYDPFIINIARGYLDEKTDCDKSTDPSHYDKETVRLANHIKTYLNKNPEKIHMYELEYTPTETLQPEKVVIVAMAGQMPNIGIISDNTIKNKSPK